MDGAIVQNDSDVSVYQPQLLSESIVKPASSSRTKIENVLADLVVETKTNVRTIFENHLTKWASRLQWRIVKDVELTFAETLQASCFDSYSGLKYVSFNVVEQARGKVIQFSPALQCQRPRCAASFRVKL